MNSMNYEFKNDKYVYISEYYLVTKFAVDNFTFFMSFYRENGLAEKLLDQIATVYDGISSDQYVYTLIYLYFRQLSR